MLFSEIGKEPRVSDAGPMVDNGDISVCNSRADRSRLAWIIVFNGLLLAFLLIAPKFCKAVPVVDNLASVVGALVASIWCFNHYFRLRSTGSLINDCQPNRSIQLPVVLVGLGIFCFVIGSCIWSYIESYLGRPAFPSWADAAFISAYPLVLAGILSLSFRPADRVLRGRVTVDGLMTMTALAIYSWFFTIGPTLLVKHQTMTGMLLSVAYPLGDLMLLFCLVVLCLQPGDSAMRPVVLSISLGLCAIVVTDTLFAYKMLHGTYHTGSVIDVGWPLGFMMIGRAVCLLNPLEQSSENGIVVDSHRVQSMPIWRVIAPYALLPATIGLTCYVLTSHVRNELAIGVYIGCVILIGMAILRQIFTIVENNRLYEHLKKAYAQVADRNDSLQELAIRDSMTGLANHGAFQERLRTEVEHSSHVNQPLALIILDVDFFKRYNDMFGHPAGDTVLRELGKILAEKVRSTDLVARYGGEEFAVILSGASISNAISTAESLRVAIATHKFANTSVTVSIGIATTEQPNITQADLVERADQALYGAKHAGRNCVAFWDSDSSDGNSPGVKIAVTDDSSSDNSSRCLSPIGIKSLLEQHAFGEVLTGPEGQMLEGVLAALDLRDCETAGHSVRVARYSLRLAIEASRRELAHLHPRDLQELVFGALLHDVGKIGVPDSILLKADSLNDEEWQVVYAHPERGTEFLKMFPYLHGAIPVVNHHHERWDGTGYPDCLCGEEIPVTARVFAIADAFDAMTTDRPYRARASYEIAAEEIRQMAGKQFDPVLVEAFLHIPKEDWDRIRQHQDISNNKLSQQVPDVAA